MEQQTKHSPLVGVVGLGLIGGSIGLDLQSLGWRVNGLVHRSKTAERAKARGLAQLISTNPTILSKCDLIILAMPLQEVINPAPELIKALPNNAVITDVGSVKSPVLKAWREIHPRFVGSHPMAGKATSGVESGQHGLFKGRPWVSTPNRETDLEALNIINQLALTLGSQWITTDAESHDQAVGLISHLPVLISASLLKTVDKEQSQKIKNLAQKLASSGFEDTTRVGGGNPQLGSAMAAGNTKAILKAIAEYRLSLNQIEKSIIDQDWERLEKELQSTQTFRSSFLNSNIKT